MSDTIHVLASHDALNCVRERIRLGWMELPTVEISGASFAQVAASCGIDPYGPLVHSRSAALANAEERFDDIRKRGRRRGWSKNKIRAALKSCQQQLLPTHKAYGLNHEIADSLRRIAAKSGPIYVVLQFPDGLERPLRLPATVVEDPEQFDFDVLLRIAGREATASD